MYAMMESRMTLSVEVTGELGRNGVCSQIMYCVNSMQSQRLGHASFSAMFFISALITLHCIALSMCVRIVAFWYYNVFHAIEQPDHTSLRLFSHEVLSQKKHTYSNGNIDHIIASGDTHRISCSRDTLNNLQLILQKFQIYLDMIELSMNLHTI